MTEPATEPTAAPAANSAIVAPVAATAAAPQTAAVERPANIPEKFWTGSVADSTQKMSDAYTQLEQKQATQAKPDASADDGSLAIPGVDKPAAAQAQSLPPEATIDQVVTKSGLDPYELGQRFRDNGGVTDEDLAKLQTTMPGLTQGMVNQYMQMTIAQAEVTNRQINQTAIDTAGGQEQLTNLVAWADQNLSQDELASFNADAQNPAKIADVINALKARYAKNLGADKTNALITGDGTSAANSGAFADRNEFLAAMRKKEYTTDPEYRKQVDARASKSDRSVTASAI